MLPYNYKLEVTIDGEIFLNLNGRTLGLIDEVVLEDKFITFKYMGNVVRQHFRRPNRSRHDA